MEPAAWTFLILGAAIVAFISSRIPLAVVAVGVAVALWATGVLTLPEALSGFGDPTVVFIATLFIVSEALDATGVTAWMGHQVITRAGTSRPRLTTIVALMVAVLAAFISINGAVASLLPVVVVVGVSLAASSSPPLHAPTRATATTTARTRRTTADRRPSVNDGVHRCGPSAPAGPHPVGAADREHSTGWHDRRPWSGPPCSATCDAVRRRWPVRRN